MSAINRYVFRQAAAAFFGGLILLTVVVWITQILRQVDLITTDGQTILVFLYASTLVIPMLLGLLAPISLFAAVVQTLNKLSGDSELIVMSAAGMSPRQMMQPYIILALIVSVLSGVLSLELAPRANRELRELYGKIAANAISVVVQPGQFNSAMNGLTFHIRDRTAGGVLRGILVVDRRQPKIQSTYVAERGVITELPQGSFLVLDEGNLQRKQLETDEISIVQFDRYALDLSDFNKAGEVKYRPQERSIAELLKPQDDRDGWTRGQPGAYQQELFDRLAAPLYPIAMMCIAFALLGRARTTRQGRAWAIMGAIGAMALVRGLGFAVSAMAAGNPMLGGLIFAVPLMAIAIYGTSAIGLYDVAPEKLINWLNMIADRVMGVFHRSKGQSA